MQQKIAKIDSVQRQEALLILIIKFGAAMIKGPRLRAGNAVRRQGAIFPSINDPRQQARWPAFFINIGRHNQLFHQTLLIIGV